MQNMSSANVRSGKLPLRTFVIFGTGILVTVSCTWWFTKAIYQNRKIEDKTFGDLDSTIRTFNYYLLMDNKEKYDRMENRLAYPETKEKTMIWKPKLDLVLRAGVHFHDYIQNVKVDLRNDIVFKEKNREMFQNIIDSMHSVQNLLDSIFPESKRYYYRIEYINNGINEILKNDSYSGLSDSGRFALLSKVEFVVLKSVNYTATVIDGQIAYHPVECDTFDFLIGQNSTYFIAGQTLEITAGLGTYSTSTKPTIIIDGKEQPLNAYGVGAYKKIITNEKGGSIPVSISFKDPITEETVTKVTNVLYTVLQTTK